MRRKGSRNRIAIGLVKEIPLPLIATLIFVMGIIGNNNVRYSGHLLLSRPCKRPDAQTI